MKKLHFSSKNDNKLLEEFVSRIFEFCHINQRITFVIT